MKTTANSEAELLQRAARRAELWQKTVPELCELLIAAGRTPRNPRSKTSLIGQIMLDGL